MDPEIKNEINQALKDSLAAGKSQTTPDGVMVVNHDPDKLAKMLDQDKWEQARKSGRYGKWAVMDMSRLDL